MYSIYNVSVYRYKLLDAVGYVSNTLQAEVAKTFRLVIFAKELPKEAIHLSWFVVILSDLFELSLSPLQSIWFVVFCELRLFHCHINS